MLECVLGNRGATTSSEFGVQFLGLGYYYLSFYRKTLDRSIQFGAVGYIITLYSSKSYLKSWGVRPNFGSPPPSPRPPVVAPMLGKSEFQWKEPGMECVLGKGVSSGYWQIRAIVKFRSTLVQRSP